MSPSIHPYAIKPPVHIRFPQRDSKKHGTSSRVSELAEIISTNTSKINDYLLSNNVPQPSFEIDGPSQAIPDDVPELAEARDCVVEASIELQQLLQGVDRLLLQETNPASLQAILRFKLPFLFPVDSEISFRDLAEKANLAEPTIRIIVRHAIAYHRVFCEPRKGIVAHSAASRRMVESEKIRGAMWLAFEGVWPASMKTVDALEKFKNSQEPNASGFALANNTALPFYAYISQHPELSENFNQAMANTAPKALQNLTNAFPWSDLANTSLVLDIGGGNGHVSYYLHSRFPHLRFIVQDLAHVIGEANVEVPGVKFMAHDFFEVQDQVRIKDVDLVLLRYIFHNWSDEYCIKILRALKGILKRGCHIVVQDQVLPEPGSLRLLNEREMRSRDMIMLTLFNSRERDEADWKTLFHLADPRFKLVSAKPVEDGETTTVIVASWDTEDDV